MFYLSILATPILFYIEYREKRSVPASPPGEGVLESSALLPSKGERLGWGEGVPRAVRGEYCLDVSSDVVTVVVMVTAEAGVGPVSVVSAASVVLGDFSRVFRVGLGEQTGSCGRLGSLRRRRTDFMLSASLWVSEESPVWKTNRIHKIIMHK